MKITFIDHSGFLAELDSCALLFDYYKGEIPKTDKPLYVFASHAHPDHFNPQIFSLAEQNQPVFYLLSDDIFAHRIPAECKEQTTLVSPHHCYELGPVKVATLQSTDAGVAFLVECDGKMIYHAGDLNCWVWDGAPKFQNDAMREQYQKELELLAGKPIDVAFLPLDPRLEADFDLGIRYFLETAQAKTIFPMHMWDDYSVIPLFKSSPEYRQYAPLIQDITMNNQTFTVE